MDPHTHLLSLLASRAQSKAALPFDVLRARAERRAKACPMPGARTVQLSADWELALFLEQLLAGGKHRTWARFTAYRRRRAAAIRVYNNKQRKMADMYERISAKLAEWDDGLRAEELAAMLDEDENAVWRALRWAEHAKYLRNEGEKGWRRGWV